MSLLVVSAADVAQVTRDLTALELCEMLGSTMHVVSASETGQGPTSAVQNPQRIATESATHKTLYMPSRLTTPTQGSATSIKVVASPKPDCTVPGLPATTLLMDEETGRVQAMVNADELTGLRTAASSALATLFLADPAAENLVVFGSGTQAFYHIRLILELFPSIATTRVVVRKSSTRSDAMVARIRSRFPHVEVSVIPSERSSKAVKLADIICTCVPSTTPVFSIQDLKRGVHINAIGSYTPTMFEFPPSLISPAPAPTDQSAASSAIIDPDEDYDDDEGTKVSKIPTILVDSRSACLHEAGEIIASNISPRDLIEIGQLCDQQGRLKLDDDDDDETKEKLERLKSGPRRQSLFKCVGVGSMDVAVTRLVVEAARKRGLGTLVDF